MNFLPTYIYIIAFSFLVSLTVYYKMGREYSYLRFFPPFLLLTLAAETIGPYLASKGKNNLWLYNFFTAFEFCFYLWIISLIITSSSWKKIIRISILIYVTAAVVNILFIQGMKSFHTLTYS